MSKKKRFRWTFLSALALTLILAFGAAGGLFSPIQADASGDYGNLTVQVRDKNTGALIQGAKFEIAPMCLQDLTMENGETIGMGNRLQVTSGQDGSIQVSGLPRMPESAGAFGGKFAYLIQNMEVPEEYEPISNAWEIVWDTDNKLEGEDGPWTGSVSGNTATVKAKLEKSTTDGYVYIHLNVIDENGDAIVLGNGARSAMVTFGGEGGAVHDGEFSENPYKYFYLPGRKVTIGVIPGVKYYANEQDSPGGYSAKTGETFYFTVDEATGKIIPSQVQMDNDYLRIIEDDEDGLETLAIVNRKNTEKIYINKVDPEGNALPGATIRHLTYKSNMWEKSYTFTSGDEIDGEANAVMIAPDIVYRLDETAPPDGYVYQDLMWLFFKIDSDGNVAVADTPDGPWSDHTEDVEVYVKNNSIYYTNKRTTTIIVRKNLFGSDTWMTSMAESPEGTYYYSNGHQATIAQVPKEYLDHKFKFTIEFTDDIPDGKYGDLEIKNNKGTFELSFNDSYVKDPESANSYDYLKGPGMVLKDLPIGLHYTITEERTLGAFRTFWRGGETAFDRNGEKSSDYGRGDGAKVEFFTVEGVTGGANGKSEIAEYRSNSVIKRYSLINYEKDLDFSPRLAGAVYDLYTADGEKVMTIDVDKDYGFYLPSVNVGDEYYLVETKAPDGFVRRPGKLEFVVDGTYTLKPKDDAQDDFRADDRKWTYYERDLAYTRGLIIYNERGTTVTVSKVAQGQTKELTGAVLSITGTNSRDQEVDEIRWTTGEEPEQVILAAGEYTLKEVTAPEGYMTARPIAFTVEADGTVKVDGEALEEARIVMEDEPIPGIHKTVNGEAAAKLKSRDETASYDIFMTVPGSADEIVITDDLIDVLEFADVDKTTVKIDGETLDEEVQSATLTQEGKNLTVKLDKEQIKEYAGKEIRITFSVKIVEGANLLKYMEPGIPNEARFNLDNTPGSTTGIAILGVPEEDKEITQKTPGTTDTPTEPPETPPLTDEPPEGETSVEKKDSGSSTGDESNVILPVMLLLTAAAAGGALTAYRRRRNNG